jgi:hypothetical protein
MGRYWGILSGAFSFDILKTLALEDIYADPHKLDSYLDSGEAVALVRGGIAVAEFVPHKVDASRAEKRPSIDYKARFLKMWGPEAFASGASVAEEFAELRQGRTL